MALPMAALRVILEKLLKVTWESIEMSSLYLQKQDMICGMAHMENGDQKNMLSQVVIKV